MACFSRKFCALALITFLFFAEAGAFVQNKADAEQILNPNRIMHISYANSAGIEASRNKLKSAEYNFKLFESEYTQFLPLVLDTRMKRKSGNETVDNLIQALRSLSNTEVDFYKVANDYFDNVRDLQYLCGVYFEELGIDVQ